MLIHRPLSLSRRYLIELDDHIRNYASLYPGSTFRRMAQSVRGHYASIHRPWPPKKLITARAIRVLPVEDLAKIFRESEVVASFNDIIRWKELTISQILDHPANYDLLIES